MSDGRLPRDSAGNAHRSAREQGGCVTRAQLLNVHVAGHRVDALYRDHQLVVELDGWAKHKTQHAFKSDRRQDADILTATGIPTVRLPYDDTVHRPADTAERD